MSFINPRLGVFRGIRLRILASFAFRHSFVLRHLSLTQRDSSRPSRKANGSAGDFPRNDRWRTATCLTQACAEWGALRVYAMALTK